MALVYVIANLIFTFKLLVQTASRLEKTVTRLDQITTKGNQIVANYRRPFLFMRGVSLKVQSIVSKIVHIFK
ncbi:hypothetical protein [Beduini sp.]